MYEYALVELNSDELELAPTRVHYNHGICVHGSASFWHQSQNASEVRWWQLTRDTDAHTKEHLHQAQPHAEVGQLQRLPQCMAKVVRPMLSVGQKPNRRWEAHQANGILWALDAVWSVLSLSKGCIV